MRFPQPHDKPVNMLYIANAQRKGIEIALIDKNQCQLCAVSFCKAKDITHLGLSG
jgi:hypothetical protein